MSYVALMVEDSIPNGIQYSESLRQSGFEVVWHTNASEAWTYLSDNVEKLIDLIVLDREIPEGPGDTESVAAGDKLFELVQDSRPDTPIFVFTAHSTPKHTQHVLSDRGQLVLGPSNTVDRVQIMYKEQGLRFLESARKIVDSLNRLQDVHVMWTGVINDDRSRALRRLFAKLAARNSCLAVRVQPLGGGRSGDEVFELALLDRDGIVAAAFVGKTRKPNWVQSYGGMYGLPHEIVAPHVDLVSGMAGGIRLELFPIVSGASPLDALIKAESADAPIAIAALGATLTGHAAPVTRLEGFADLVAPLVSPDFLVPQLTEMGMTPPRETLSVLSKRFVQHGDLHGGNVLVKDGRPTMIDFGKVSTASQLLDPVTLLLSMWLHPDGKWFESAESDEPVATIEAIIARDLESVTNAALRATAQWIADLEPDPRELWSISLAYAVRQMWYETAQNPVAKERVKSICAAAIRAIAAD